MASSKRMFAGRLFAPRVFAPALLRGVGPSGTIIAGPYYRDGSQAFVAGSRDAQPFLAGAERSQVHIAGSKQGDFA